MQWVSRLKGQEYCLLSVSSQCCVLVNVSPDLQDAVETLSTLQFGSSVRQVTLGRATQNVVPAKSSRNVK